MKDELLDWEMLHVSDKESTDSVTTEMKSASSSVIDDGMLLSYHFSAENLIKRSPEITYDTQYSVMKPGHSSRVDYGSESVEVPVDLGFDQLNSKQLGEDCVSEESGFCDLETGIYGDGEVKQSDFQAVDEKHVESEADDRHVESQSGVEEPIEDSSKSWSDDSREKEMVSGDSEVVNGDEEIVSETEGSGGNTVEVVAVDSSAVSSGDESSKSRETVWWKLPYVVFKYCAFRMSPVWSVSMAAAVMGLILLGRRLYNMKKKSQRFHLQVTIDDKKAARVMSQAARHNEVFTEVRRVPVIRPALPSPGVWPVLNLR